MTLLLMVPRTSSINFLTLLVQDMDQNGAMLLLISSWVEDPKFLSQSRQVVI